MYPYNVDQNNTDGPSDNYAGRAKKRQKLNQNNVNILNNQSENEYQISTQKIKITIYKNGFTINNGEFRDIKIQENNIFVKQILNGIIPQELKNKGINRNITLDKRLNEEFISYSPNISSYETGKFTINTTNINQKNYVNNIYQDNTHKNYIDSNNAYQNYNNYNINNPNINNNINIDYAALTNQKQIYNNPYNNNYYHSQGNQNNIYVKDLNNYMNNLNVHEYPVQPKPNIVPIPININNNVQNTKNINNIATPVVNNYGTDNNNLFQKKEQVNDDNEKTKKKNVAEKKDVEQKKSKKNFRTFGSWIKEEKEKEEEKELRKMQRHNIPPKNPIKEDPNEHNLKNEEPKKEKPKKKKRSMRTFGSWIREEKEKEDENQMKKMQKFNLIPKEPIKEEPAEKEEGKNEKKFVPFGGEGYMIENVNVEGLHVNKDLKHTINELIPKCQFNIRLFNGEIIKSEFNYTQTLGDVYIYVKNTSGCNNFVLLEGFPPKPLNQLNKNIQELNLENTTLTQKITEK